jgi:hypothetical protein
MPWSTFLRIGLILVLAGCDAQQSANAPTVIPSAHEIEQLTMLHDQLRQARMNIEVQYQQAPGRETSCVKPPFLFIAPETLIRYDVDFIKASNLLDGPLRVTARLMDRREPQRWMQLRQPMCIGVLDGEPPAAHEYKAPQSVSIPGLARTIADPKLESWEQQDGSSMLLRSARRMARL